LSSSNKGNNSIAIAFFLASKSSRIASNLVFEPSSSLYAILIKALLPSEWVNRHED
jgi:hypothetical protein